jgi:hypothetical protein
VTSVETRERFFDWAKVWRTVAHNRDEWQKRSPEGFEAIVRVTVAGVGSFVVSEVQTSFRREDPLVMLYVASEDSTDDRVVMTMPEHVLATEILYSNVNGNPIGFRHSESASSSTK